MASPVAPIPGHVLLGQLGEGSCGEVWLSKSSDGRLCAFKFFKSMGINRRLLQGAHARLAESEGHPCVVKILATDFDQRPAWVQMDFHGQTDATGIVPWTLNDWMVQNLEASAAWEIIRQIADGLAFLHRIGVAHANLHPGNVLITDPESGRIALTDFTQGWVNGIYQLDGTEAMLYASPEQLRDPAGIDQGLWGGWDVFAFGSLAYRLLSGSFPREDAARRRLEAAHGADQAISPGDVLPLFPAGVTLDWGNREAADWEESARREVIERCLAIDPDARFKDMREVVAEFAKIDEEKELREERERIRELRMREVKALQFSRRLALVLGICSSVATLAALVYANKFRVAARESADLKTRFTHALAEKDLEMERRLADARSQESKATAAAAGAVKEATAMKETLIRSQEQADALFAVVRDRRPATEPGFKDIRQTATELTRFYEDFLAKLGKEANLDPERARAMDNLAELARSAENRDAALRWQTSANALWEKLAAKDPSRREYRTRWAGGLLEVCQASLRANKLQDASAQATKARGLLEALVKEPSADTTSLRLLAACYLQLGRIERQQGRADTALEMYRAARDQLRLLSSGENRFDYRSALAASYVESGELARGIEDLEKAANIQRAALSQLVSLVEEKPEMPMPRLELARAYGELGVIESLVGNPEKATEMLVKSLGLLDGVLTESPGSEMALYEKARRSSALARLQRDEGKRTEAEKLVGGAHAILSNLAKDPAAKPEVRHQLALVLWQKAELQGDLSQPEEAIITLKEAITLLEGVAKDTRAAPDLQWQVATDRAFLNGELGHRLEEAKKPEEAIAAFQSAVKLWEAAAVNRRDSPAIVDGLAWSKKRLQALQSPAQP